MKKKSKSMGILTSRLSAKIVKKNRHLKKEENPTDTKNSKSSSISDVDRDQNSFYLKRHSRNIIQQVNCDDDSVSSIDSSFFYEDGEFKDTNSTQY